MQFACLQCLMTFVAGPPSPGTTSFTNLPPSPSPAPSLAGGQPTVPVLTPPGDRQDAGPELGAAGSSQDGEKDGKKKKNRCHTCKKKVGLTGFTCRCGGLFCSIHRYSDKHQCDFDYKVGPSHCNIPLLILELPGICIWDFLWFVPI